MMTSYKKIRKYDLILLFGIILLTGVIAEAQTSSDLDKISASQAGSSPLLFTVPDNNVQPVVLGNFSHHSESNVRSGIPNFLHKIKEGNEITVAFIGGSITQSRDGYRMETARYIQRHFSGIIFKWVNAGVSGTGTDLGAFRIREQVLQYRPDLIFIEFAVNGAYQPGMEGMIRQIIKANPLTDICLIYTIQNGQTAAYQRGEVPANIQGLELIAEYYQLPSIHLGLEAAILEKRNKLVWKATKQQTNDHIVFSSDGIHPVKEGGDLYAATIARAIVKMDNLDLPLVHMLPPPLITDSWDEAGMYDPHDIALFDKNWIPIITNKSKFKQFQGWFDTIVTAGKPGASLTFYFEGDQFGVFDIGGPEVGQISLCINDQPVALKKISEQGYRLWEVCDMATDTLLNRFNQYCNNRYRGQYDVIQLAQGRHKVTLRISQTKADKHEILGTKQLKDITANFDKYNQTVIFLGKILLRGKPVKGDTKFFKDFGATPDDK